MYTLNLNNTLVKGRMSDIFNVIDRKYGKDAKVMPHATYSLTWSVYSLSTGDLLGTIDYTDKENDPIRRSFLKTQSLNRKN